MSLGRNKPGIEGVKQGETISLPKRRSDRLVGLLVSDALSG
jgi:hypothetical protein